jgi:hypothetical protein
LIPALLAQNQLRFGALASALLSSASFFLSFFFLLSFFRFLAFAVVFNGARPQLTRGSLAHFARPLARALAVFLFRLDSALALVFQAE